MVTLFLDPRLRSRSRSRGRGGYRPPMTTGCGGGPLYHLFLGGGGRLVTPQFQHGGPMASVVHDAHWQSGRCLKVSRLVLGLKIKINGTAYLPGSLRCLCSQARSCRLLRFSRLLRLLVLLTI